MTRKEIRHAKTAIPHITYRFRTLAGDEREAGMDVPQPAYDSLQIGQEITVLYDPDDPQSNVIYRCGDFDVLSTDDKTL